MSPAAYEEGWPSEKVSGLRYRLGVSQQQMARLLGVRQQTVSDWETGLHEPQGASRRMLSIIEEDPARYTTARDRERGQRNDEPAPANEAVHANEPAPASEPAAGPQRKPVRYSTAPRRRRARKDGHDGG